MILLILGIAAAAGPAVTARAGWVEGLYRYTQQSLIEDGPVYPGRLVLGWGGARALAQGARLGVDLGPTRRIGAALDLEALAYSADYDATGPAPPARRRDLSQGQAVAVLARDLPLGDLSLRPAVRLGAWAGDLAIHGLDIGDQPASRNAWSAGPLAEAGGSLSRGRLRLDAHAGLGCSWPASPTWVETRARGAFDLGEHLALDAELAWIGRRYSLRVDGEGVGQVADQLATASLGVQIGF